MSLAEVEIVIGSERWGRWEQVTLQRSLDNFSTVTFTGPFEPGRQEMRQTLRPFQFQDLTVKVDGEDLFTGTMMSPQPKQDENGATVEVSGYAKPAVLMDAHIPGDNLPVQWSKVTIADIARSLCEPFGIGVAPINGTTGAAFRRVKLKADEPPGRLIAELARQRGLVVRDNGKGELLLTESAQTSRPVAQLVEGEPPLQVAEATFSPQDYFSAITGLAKSKPERIGGKHTEQNPHLSGVVRPYSFEAEDVDKGDLPGAVQAKLGRMFANMAAYVVQVPSWYDASGNLWAPNTTVSLKAPGAMVYDHYEFLIRDVIQVQDHSGEQTKLGLVLPGAFSGESPASLPWD